MTSNLKQLDRLPDWVPPAVRLYLTHTESGRSLRDIARSEGVHASTVLRQVRRFENRRDDPLVDCALDRLLNAPDDPEFSVSKDSHDMESSSIRRRPQTLDNAATVGAAQAPDEAALNGEAVRVLRRMAEPGAFLAVAGDMARAV
ncbi:MAG TPA: helix-turn-helix domain-containing protein, partial [Paracoccus sp.]|nr:helix-turn-helix domain-containing protein [Paracoccus sp. (in: a-proteobacteria)]